jgi:hypothetical protein
MDEVGRGTSAAASIEKEIANLIDAEIAELDAVDQELDAVEKEKETPPPPLPEDEFPSEESPFDAMLPPEGGGGEGDEGTPTGGEDGFGDENPKDPNEPVPDPDDEKFLNKQQTLVNLTKGLNQIGLPNDFAQWTINYAKGDMTPINKFSRGMERQVRDLVLDKFNKNPNAKTVNINYNDYGYRFKALPTRLGMGRFKATKLDNGKIRVQDTFNVNKDFTNIGSASIVPGLQKTADRLVDISYKNRNIKGREDKGGITIDVVIPGASAVKKYDKNKKRKVNESNTFSKVKKFKNKY